MGEFTDKAKGYANEAVGNVKEEVGKILGNENLRVEGIVQEGKGQAQQLKAAAEAKMKDVQEAATTAASSSSAGSSKSSSDDA